MAAIQRDLEKSITHGVIASVVRSSGALPTAGPGKADQDPPCPLRPAHVFLWAWAGVVSGLLSWTSVVKSAPHHGYFPASIMGCRLHQAVNRLLPGCDYGSDLS